MLSLVTENPRSTGRCNRRDWLRFGSLAGLHALTTLVPPIEAGQGTDHRESAGFGTAKSVIVVFANGGQSQLEMWDPKPNAPLEVRGEFNAIRTSVSGTLLTEHMPRISRIVDKLTIVRSMSHMDLDHGSAFYLSMTGQYHNRISSNPLPQATDYPALGSILKRLKPTHEFVETSINVNGPALVPIITGPGQFGGLLGRNFDPMLIGDVTDQHVVVPGLAPRRALPNVRLDARQSLLQTLDAQCRHMEDNRPMLDLSVLYRRAFEMLSRPETRQAFDLADEPTSLRERYGRNRSGQACLLARRLVEAKVPLITVFWNHSNRGQDLKPSETDAYGWDTHNDIFDAMKVRLLPRFDLGFSALIEDLDARGLLDDTLVICMGEFGRAPLVAREPRFAGTSPGRKHWAAVYSIAVAGAGIGRGKVLGKSNSHAAYPSSEKYGPWDVSATIFSALGVDPSGHYRDATGRPYPISGGRPIAGLYSG